VQIQPAIPENPQLSEPTAAQTANLVTSQDRRLRELVAELEELSLAIAEADPRWNR
jgi:hypothetical protein